jgi:hypothetical protein
VRVFRREVRCLATHVTLFLSQDTTGFSDALASVTDLIRSTQLIKHLEMNKQKSDTGSKMKHLLHKPLSYKDTYVEMDVFNSTPLLTALLRAADLRYPRFCVWIKFNNLNI